MSTIDPAPDGSPHQARAVAESFGADPARYDRTRPRYPQALVHSIVEALPGRELLDVGIGTGISALPFRDAGCRVSGIEVDARMAAFASDRGFAVEVSKFEEWDPAGRLFDGVIAGQAWHWIDPLAGAIKAASALRPGGLLAPFWNVHQLNDELAAVCAEVYQRVVPDTPLAATPTDAVAAYERILVAAEDGIRRSGVFTEPERQQYGWDHTYSKSEWLEQVQSFGGHNLLTPDQLSALLAGLSAAIHEHGQDKVAVHYTTLTILAQRT